MGNPGGANAKIVVNIGGEGVEFHQDQFPAGTSVRQVLEKFGVSSEGKKVTIGEDEVQLDANLTSDSSLTISKL